MEKESLNLNYLLSQFCADVDIFLLRDEAQEKTKDEVYTPVQIREQLMKSKVKFIEIFKQFGVDCYKTLLIFSNVPPKIDNFDSFKCKTYEPDFVE
jgi:hypothetical protein